MKKAVLICISALVALLFSCKKEDGFYNDDGSPITMEQALEIVGDEVDFYDWVEISTEIIKKGTKFTNYLDTTQSTYSVPYDSWIVMIDTNPQANSGRFWLYIYVNAYSGRAAKTSWQWSIPVEFGCKTVKSNIGADPLSPNDIFPSLGHSVSTRSENTSISNNWAVIISGGMSPSLNRERYWNDCSAIYKCLRQVYNYQRGRIIVLMSDGTSSGLDRHMNGGTYTSSPQDLDGDGVNDINYAATKANITAVFNQLRNNVAANEQVFVFVTDHGARINDESYINLWNNTTISATEFAAEVSKINSSSRKHVVMGQCYSGGFINKLFATCPNISVAAACSESQLSYAREGNLYDEYLYHWISAAAGTTPDTEVSVNAESNGYDGISIQEIGKYADDQDILSETNQYESDPDLMSKKYGLSGEEFGYPVLSGSMNLSSSSSGQRFEIAELPDTYTLLWQSSSNVSLPTTTQSYAIATHSADEAMELGWVKATLITPVETHYLNKEVYLWKPGINFTQTLITGSLQGGTFSLPYSSPEQTNYVWSIDYVEESAISNGYPVVEFTPYAGETPDGYYVSVEFTNPLGEGMTIVRHFD